MADKDLNNVDVRLESPLERLSSVTPGASPLPFVTRAISALTAGTVELTTVAGDTGVIHLEAGMLFPIRCTHILSGANTTATGIVALA